MTFDTTLMRAPQENILLSDRGEPLLADFGLSTILGEEGMYTPSHGGGGSARWMSPEQMNGGSRSCQSDVYSFGSLVFTVNIFPIACLPVVCLTCWLFPLGHDGGIAIYGFEQLSNPVQALQQQRFCRPHQRLEQIPSTPGTRPGSLKGLLVAVAKRKAFHVCHRATINHTSRIMGVGES